MDSQPKTQTSRFSVSRAVVWFVIVVAVGVLGTMLLAESGIGIERSMPRIIGWVMAAEVLLYLAALLAPAASVPFAGLIGGVVGGMAVRAIIALLCAVVRGAPDGGIGEAFGYYYASYWSGVCLQIFVVAVYLWLVRPLLERPRVWRPEPRPALSEEPQSNAERQRMLLAALREGDEPAPEPQAPAAAQAHPVEVSAAPQPQPAPEPEPTEPEVEVSGARVREERGNATAPEPAVPEANVAEPAEGLDAAAERNEDTSEFEAVGKPALQLPLSEPEPEPAPEPVVEEPVETAVAAAPGSLIEAAAEVAAAAAQLAEIAHIGAAKLVLAFNADASLGLVIDGQTGKALLQDGTPNLGQFTTRLRNLTAEADAAGFECAGMALEARLRCETDSVLAEGLAGVIGAMAASWHAVMTGLRFEGRPVIVLASAGSDAGAIAFEASALAAALGRATAALKLSAFTRVLISGTTGALGVGWASLAEGEALIALLGAGSPQVAMVNVRLGQIVSAIGESWL